MDGRSIVALGIGGAALILLVASALLRQRQMVSQMISSIALPAGALIGALYLPEVVGNWVTISILCVLAVLSESWLILLIVAVGAAAVANWVPGGWNAAVLVLIGLACVVAWRDALRHLVRLRRARALEPGREPARTVELSGRVAAGKPAPPPGADIRAAWWLARRIPDQVTSGQLRLESDAGTVLVEADAGKAELAARRQIVKVSAVELDRLFPGATGDEQASEGNETEPKAGDAEEQTYELFWLELGDHVYVVGKPEWTRGPAAMAGYRDAPLVPLFAGKELFVSNGSAAEVARQAVLQLVTWALWSGAVGATAAARLAGW